MPAVELIDVSLRDRVRRSLTVEDKEGNARTIPYDTLIVSLMRRPEDRLFEDLKDVVPEVYQIGDRLNLDPGIQETANIKGAVWSANEVARKI